MAKSTTYIDILRTLKSGTEVNVYTKNKTYYDAVFCKFNLHKGMALLKLDHFYDSGGYLAEVPVSEIISMDIPYQEFSIRE